MKFNRQIFWKEYREEFGRTDRLSWQMLPSGAAFDASDVSAANSVVSGNQAVDLRVSNNCQNLRFRQFGIGGFAVSVSAFANCIVRVLLHRSASQVVKPTARRVIADVMPNRFAGNVLAGFESVGHSVSQNELSVKVKSSISVMVKAASPKPATVGLLNKFIQSISQWTLLFSFLITRVRAVFQTFLFCNKGFGTTSALLRSVNLHAFKAACVRAVHAFRCAERKKLSRTYLACTRCFNSLIYRFHALIITLNDRRLEVHLSR